MIWIFMAAYSIAVATPLCIGHWLLERKVIPMVSCFIIFPHELDEFSWGGSDNINFRRIIVRCRQKHREPIFFPYALITDEFQKRMAYDTLYFIIKKVDRVHIAYEGHMTSSMLEQINIAQKLEKEFV